MNQGVGKICRGERVRFSGLQTVHVHLVVQIWVVPRRRASAARRRGLRAVTTLSELSCDANILLSELFVVARGRLKAPFHRGAVG